VLRAIVAAVLTVTLLAAHPCEGAARPTMLAAQIADTVTTYYAFRRFNFVEKDPLVRPFAGSSRRNILGMIAAGIAFDAIMFHLTRKSPQARCNWERAQTVAHTFGFFYTLHNIQQQP
jgi:hypothetical protein